MSASTHGAQSKLDLDPGMVAACRHAAKQIADQVAEQTAGRTTVSVERSVTRLLGVDGADALEVPLQRTQALVDVADFGGNCAGISRSSKHVFTPRRGC